MIDSLTLGALYLGAGRCSFRVWAPVAERVDLVIVSPSNRVIPMESAAHGYYQLTLDEVEPGSRYFYRLNGETDRPDPASRYQPEGVHGPSEVVDTGSHVWRDQAWSGIPLADYVIYELHVGTFTSEGTFEAIIPHLDTLVDLGVTMVELMPVNQFPGERNWGYDGVGIFAVQNSYGGPEGLKRLVDACHHRGIGVILDVVYNHLGPEGNYLPEFGNYFTDYYSTPWGEAMNFDGAGSDEVRRFFIENALHWMLEYHIDSFRVDAVHAMLDQLATHFLQELTEAIQRTSETVGRLTAVIAESDLNDPRLIRSRDIGGYGMDGQWTDDFHHALHALLTGEHDGYYRDVGTIHHLAEAFRQGYVFTGQYSEHRQRRHGTAHNLTDGRRFVVCSQNHDQVGNRATGDRFSTLLDFEQLKLAAGATILSPFIPMLFMGEEYGEPGPFQYFVHHGDPDLVEAVRSGRRSEFRSFNWQGEVPDPQSEETFVRSKLQHELRNMPPHRELQDYYREVLRLRRSIPAFRQLDLDRQRVWVLPGTSVLVVVRESDDSDCVMFFNFSAETVNSRVSLTDGRWVCLLDSRAYRWGEIQDEGRQAAAEDLVVTDRISEVRIGPRTLLVYRQVAREP